MVLQASRGKAGAETDVVGSAKKIQYPETASRFMAYQALIKGANGIVYGGAIFTPQPSQAWDDLKRRARWRIRGGAGCAGSGRGGDDHELGHSVDDGVQLIVRDHGGYRYVFSCNADRNRAKATLSGLGDWRVCTVLHEDRTLPVEGGAITDVWGRFSVHVYRLER